MATTSGSKPDMKTARGARPVGFSLTDADATVLDELAAYFTDGNRSAYLRATFKVMRSIKLAEELRDIQARNARTLAETGHDLEDIPRMLKEWQAANRPTESR